MFANHKKYKKTKLSKNFRLLNINCKKILPFRLQHNENRRQ